MKQKIRLTEKDLHNIIENFVYRILQENGMDEKIDWKGNLKRGAIGLGMLGATAAADKLYDINHDDEYDPQEIELSNQQYQNDLDYYDEYGQFPDDSMPLYEKRNKNLKNMKKIIRLTESDIHKIVENSVKRILQEGDSDLASQAAGTAARAAAKTRGLRGLFSKKTPEQYAAQSARLRNLAKERRVGAEADYKDAMNRYEGYRDYDNDANAWITKHYSDDELANLRAQFISDKKDENNDIYSKARSGEPIQRGEDGSYVKQGRRLPKFGRGDK